MPRDCLAVVHFLLLVFYVFCSRSGTKVLFGLVYMTALQGKKNSRDVKQDNSSPENLFSLGNSE